MLQLRDITHRYGDRTALADVSFDVRPGVLTGFVGANGAGKTTAMRVVLGLARPDRGSIRWDGEPVTPERRRRIGYMPEERGLYPQMTVLDQLVFFGSLSGLSRRDARSRGRELLDHLGLGDRAGDRLETLSLGNQQRAQLAVALVHRPSLLLLDEPFSGLDPVAVDVLGALLREQAAAGVPVLFSSHQLDLVERLCDDVVMIDGGRVVAAGPADVLRAERSRSRYRVVLGEDAQWLRALDDLTVRSVEGRSAVVELEAMDDQELLGLALQRGPVHELRPLVPTLSEVFREVLDR